MTPTIEREPGLIAAEQALMQVRPDVTDALVLKRDPELVLAEATMAAKALMAVMAQKPKKVMLNGEQYIENEDWLTIGHFYGVTAQIESDRVVQFGDVCGWEATAVLVARDGRVLGRATAMCLNDEEKWSTRPKKEWAYCLGPEDDHTKHEHSLEDPGSNRIIWRDRKPVRHRIVTGDEKVPLFQLRSMAQTRASSKVHASVLRFVPVLAGYKGTPAEEMPDAEHEPNVTVSVSRAPTPTTATAAPAAGQRGGATPAAAAGGDPRPTYGVLSHAEATAAAEGHAVPEGPPPGYVYIDAYQFSKQGWHDVRVGNTKFSTKTDVGLVAREAFEQGCPVKLDSRPKDGTKGEHWLNGVEKWSGSDAHLQ